MLSDAPTDLRRLGRTRSPRVCGSSPLQSSRPSARLSPHCSRPAFAHRPSSRLENSVIVPLLKDALKEHGMSNLRPISLQSCLGKLFNKILAHRLSDIFARFPSCIQRSVDSFTAAPSPSA